MYVKNMGISISTLYTEHLIIANDATPAEPAAAQAGVHRARSALGEMCSGDRVFILRNIKEFACLVSGRRCGYRSRWRVGPPFRLLVCSCVIQNRTLEI